MECYVQKTYINREEITTLKLKSKSMMFCIKKT